jgi:putative transcriptional regulator
LGKHFFYFNFLAMLSPAPGVLLIADPFLKDTHFQRSVVMLCDHHEEGSFGFVINKKFEHKLDQLIAGFSGFPLDVYYGGPVQTDTLHFMHQYPNHIPGGMQVADGVYWGGDFSLLTEKLQGGVLDASRLRFYIGYSGWGRGQLQNELDEKSWLTVSATRKLIFHRNIEEVWKDSLLHLGGEYRAMINYPLDPQLN